MNLGKYSSSSCWAVIVLFPLYGIFSYLRVLEQQAVGYAIFIVPMIVYLVLQGIKFTISNISIPVSFLTRRSNFVHSLALHLYVLAMIAGLFVSALSGSRPWDVVVAEMFMLGLAYVFLILIIGRASSRHQGLTDVYNKVFISLVIYVLINVAAAISGIESSAAQLKYSREFEALLSPFETRQQFPFTLNGQYFSIIGGILIILSFGYSGTRDKILFFRLITILLGSFVLIGHSARAPILALFLVAGYALLPRKIKINILLISITFLLVFPFIFITFDLGGGLEYLFNTLGITLSRSEGDISTLSNRYFIWSSALNQIDQESEIWNVVFGYGAHGHITSGVVNNYVWLFSASYVDLENPHLHSSYIQTLVDFGLIGFFMLSLIFFILLNKFKSIKVTDGSHARESSALLMVFFYISLCAVTEVIIGYFAIDILLIFLFVNMFIMAVRADSANKYMFKVR